MRVLRTIVSTAVLLLVSVVAFAQLSDQQVINEVRRMQATGASQQQILTELAAKGVTREQAERIYADYQAQGAAQTGTVMSTESRTRDASNRKSSWCRKPLHAGQYRFSAKTCLPPRN